jgi:hypothetical protein
MDFDRFSVALLSLRLDAPQLRDVEAAELHDAHMSYLAEASPMFVLTAMSTRQRAIAIGIESTDVRNGLAEVVEGRPAKGRRRGRSSVL